MKKRVVAMALSTVFIASMGTSLVGCRKPDGPKIDKTKTQLYVSNYDAGIGTTWVEEIGKSFEEKFASYSFEEGRKGVQIIYNHNRIYTGTNLENQISAATENIFFTEYIDYTGCVAKGLFYDVTDLMNEGAYTGVDDNGNITKEEVSIESKIDGEFLNFLDRNEGEAENYYGAPYYLAMKSVVYDKDLWNENAYYFAKQGGCPSEAVAMAVASNGDVEAAQAKYYSDLAAVKAGEKELVYVNADGYNAIMDRTLGLSAGPDGQYGTHDDGLPATYEEFYLLMDKMVGDSVIPFIWTGKYAGYADMLTNALWRNHDGVENLKTYYTLQGKMDNLVKISNDGLTVEKDSQGNPKTEEYTFNGGVEDGYNAHRSEGKYYALQFAQKLASNDQWTKMDVCYNTSESHITAQKIYVTSIMKNGTNRIAMLCDGGWWQQESNTTFETMEAQGDKYSKYNRSFDLMMTPNATIEKTAERAVNKIKNVNVALNESFVVLNGNMKEGSPQLAVAKAFFSYINNDAMLNKFSEYTNIKRGMNYEIDSATEATLTPFGKNFMKYVEGSDIVYPYTSNKLFLNNRTYMNQGSSAGAWGWHTLTKTDSSMELYYAVMGLHEQANKAKGLTGETFFTGLYNYNKTIVWPKLNIN